ncbi:MAG: LutB/LldF family L-lactate oxidation iron-sulfur protein [Alphaproteobacteria bacterium]|nr:LutB/LldF family L-lactate oxidation iron-sulfur protein [Alphaproteobacteria bacterium]
MTHQTTSHSFPSNARVALRDPILQRALGNLKRGFPVKRAEVVADLPEFETLRDVARDIKNHTLSSLDAYLEIYEENVVKSGGKVHWARSADEACETVMAICRDVDAKVVTKGKSMVAEEIGLNAYLDNRGIERVETDLGEYIIQLRDEPPSHIIVPAVHVTKDQIGETFRRAHQGLDPMRDLSDPRDITDEARARLREKYFQAEVGITGANFLVAENGSSIIVTNEGNGDLTQTLAKVHIVVASLEKVVPTMEDAMAVLRLLARSSTGQEFSVYTTVSNGPKRAEDLDGPDAYHVVLVDNGRTAMLGTEKQDMLRCIRCAACMNHCPVYGAVGGHAYGWVYPGPMGAVLTPSLIGVENSGHLPHASTFCGKCEQVCPMKIPLTKMMRHYRNEAYESGFGGRTGRFALILWSYLARYPSLYRLFTGLAARILKLMANGRGGVKWMPLAQGWLHAKDLPAPQGPTFMARYRRERRQ